MVVGSVLHRKIGSESGDGGRGGSFGRGSGDGGSMLQKREESERCGGGWKGACCRRSEGAVLQGVGVCRAS